MSQILSSEPRRILIAGDWHANTHWARYVARQAADLLKDEPYRLILQLGDFGVWSDFPGFIDTLSGTLAEKNVYVWFVDGNHEDFPFLEGLRGGNEGPMFIDFNRRIWHLPRGTRWYWHGRQWLAMGGAASVDKALRREGTSWFPDEEITEEQATRAMADGPADVMVTHDCPSGVPHSFPPIPAGWDPRDIDRSNDHAHRLQRVVDAVKPEHIMHGHLHRAYGRTCDFGYGPVQVTGLNCDGFGHNYAVLDTRTMEWGTDG